MEGALHADPVCMRDFSGLDLDATLAALRALRALAEARCTSKAKDYMSSRPGREDHAGRPLTPAYDEAQLPYDPAALFDLEFMVSIAMALPQHAAETWSVLGNFAFLCVANYWTQYLVRRTGRSCSSSYRRYCLRPSLTVFS